MVLQYIEAIVFQYHGTRVRTRVRTIVVNKLYESSSKTCRTGPPVARQNLSVLFERELLLFLPGDGEVARAESKLKTHNATTQNTCLTARLRGRSVVASLHRLRHRRPLTSR